MHISMCTFWGLFFNNFILNLWNDYAINMYFDTNTFNIISFKPFQDKSYTLYDHHIYIVFYFFNKNFRL